MLLRSLWVSAFILLVTAPASAQAESGTESFLSGWFLPVLLILLVGIATFVFLRFRKAKENGDLLGLAGTEEKIVSTHQDNRAASANDFKARKPKLAKPESGAGASAKPKRTYVDIRDLPIGRVESIERPSSFDHLADSDDEGLLAAIDELQDDSAADSDFRIVALRVLGGFKTRNSIEALSQIALYDLSANMRSKAVAMLADLDHESVFETIVLACADPSREVRAAGARALFKVTFDRADAWARFAFSEDQYLSRQMARAAVESGIAERSFDRLAMNDEKAAYEAFTLVYLLINSGETEKIFQAVKEHRDLNVRLALLHSIKAANVAEVIPQLSAFIAAEPMSSEVADKAREALLGINSVPVGA